MVRTFIAIPVEDSVILKNIKKIQEELKNIDKNVRPTPEENLHFTLRFLGEIHEEEIKIVKRKLDEIEFNPFNITIEGFHLLPSKSYFRVISLGVGNNLQEMEHVAKKIRIATSTIGKKENRPFKPHLTIARVKHVRNKSLILRYVEKHERDVIGSLFVEKIYLMKSTLTPSGPIYEIMHEVVK